MRFFASKVTRSQGFTAGDSFFPVGIEMLNARKHRESADWHTVPLAQTPTDWRHQYRFGGVVVSAPRVDPRTAVSSKPSRFAQYKHKHQNISIPLSVVRCGLTAPALSWYMILRATADWSSGILPEHCTPAWLEKKFKVSRWQRLCRERELHAAGLFESVQKMGVKRIRGRMRLVRQAREARIFAEPQASQNTSNNAGSFSVRFFSLLKNRTPNSSSEPDSKAPKSSKVKTKFKNTSLPLDRVAPRSPDPEVEKPKPLATSVSVLPNLTEKQGNPKTSREEKQPLHRPDLALREVLEIREKYFLVDADVRAWMNVENRWVSAGCPVDRALLVKFLDDAITSMTREGILYHPVALLRLKQLRRHEFSPRLSAPSSSSLTFTPEPGTCPRCGGHGLIQQNGVGKFCDCDAGKRLMFPHTKREGVAHERRHDGP